MEKKTLVSKQPMGSVAGRPAAAKDSQTSQWQSYHALTEHWKSDLQFEKDEVNFFRKLIAEHFAQFMDSAHAERSRKLAGALTLLDKRREELVIRMVSHSAQMFKILKNPLPIVDELLYKHDHEQLENDMLTFVKDHRLLKRKLMHLAEEILRTEKIMHLLSGK